MIKTDGMANLPSGRVCRTTYCELVKLWRIAAGRAAVLREGSRDLWIGRVVLRYATASGPASVMDHRRLRGPVKYD